MQFTKKQMMDAFLLFLDDALPSFECEKIEKEGNSNCNRCDLCMMQQYLNKAKSGKLPKVAVQNNGKDYPNINQEDRIEVNNMHRKKYVKQVSKQEFQQKTELVIQKEISKLMHKLVSNGIISHFVIADDDIISEKLTK